MSELNYIDVFAGSGGFSEGFLRHGFNPVAHIEIDKAACFTLRTRAAYHYLSAPQQIKIYRDYLKGRISRKELYSYIPEKILDSVINAEIGKDNDRIFRLIERLADGRKIDLVIGGPPCQAYSQVGWAPLKHKKEDPRTALYIQYGRFLKKYQPDLFVFENVPGLLSAAGGAYFKNLKKYFRRLGYCLEARIHNAFNYSVIQRRVRVIIVGWKKSLNYSYPDFYVSEKKYYRDDIFSDLPPVGINEKRRFVKYYNGSNEYLSQHGIRDQSGFVTQHTTRSHNQRDLEIYRFAIEQLEQGIQVRNNRIPDEMRTQKNVTDFLDRFKVVGPEPHTMIAHIAKDGHHYIHPDIRQLRSISVREAARIQSFPDNYFFEGVVEGQYMGPAFRQIGNAVPPLMAEKIAGKIKKMLCLKTP